MASIRNFLIHLLAVVVIATGAIAVYDHTASAGTAHVEQGSVLRPLPPPFPGVERLRIMLIGVDERKGDSGRSDTLMVLQVNPSLRRGLLFSLPRDLRVAIPDHGRNKINAAFAYGGADLSRRTVEDLLGTTLDGHVKINIEGFVKAIDTLGGVDINVEDVEGKGRGMNYDCPGDGLVIHLFPGPQHLTGYKAMGYVRYRHSNIPGCGGSDFDRAQRQQKLLKALLVQKLRVTNIPALMKAGQQLFGCVETTLSWREMFDLMRLMREMQPGDLKTVTLEGEDDKIGGVYYCTLSDEKLATMISEGEAFLSGLGGGDGEQTGPVLVEVLNGYTRQGAAAKAAADLTAKGFQVVKVGNATTQNHLGTSVLYRGEVQDQAQQIAEALGGAIVEQDPSGPAPDGTAQVQVTLGKNFPIATP